MNKKTVQKLSIAQMKMLVHMGTRGSVRLSRDSDHRDTTVVQALVSRNLVAAEGDRGFLGYTKFQLTEAGAEQAQAALVKLRTKDVTDKLKEIADDLAGAEDLDRDAVRRALEKVSQCL